MRLILASQSPRRKELLGQITGNFSVEVSRIEERRDPAWTAEELPRQLALQKALSINVAAEKNIVTSAVPYPIKQLVMRKSYEAMQYSYTTILSNLGEIKFPPEIQSHVLEADCCLCKTPFLHFGCAAVSFNGVMNLSFTSANRNTEREKYFFRLLASHGIPVRIDSSI